MFQAGLHFDLQRMPELFCGFPRNAAESPVPYPVACAPQAWASGAVFLLLQACLGVRIDGCASRILFEKPSLPAGLTELSIRRLPVGEGRIDVSVVRHGGTIDVNVLRPVPGVDVFVS
jgi:glycogen debranching enzyme